MKLSNVMVAACAAVILTGCMEGNQTTQFSSNRVASGLSDGFRPNETLEAYSVTNSMVRRGRIAETGDYYSYRSTPRGVEIIPVEVPFNRETVLAPKRVKVLGGCSQDRVSDRTSCRLNIIPQSAGSSRDGGLYQTVSANGSILSACILGHDFPGRRGAIRVDGNPAFTTNNDGCISGAAAQRLEQQLRTGKVLLTRYVEWPYDYSRDKEMLIDRSFSTAQDLFRWSASADLAALFNAR